MTLRDLEYVSAVADHNHFGRAAEACHVGQPTLSAQIRKLEDHLGVALFERTKKSVRLTPVGARIVEIAREMIESAERIEQTASAHRDPFAGRFRLGIIPTIAPYLIPIFIKRLEKRLPRLEIIFVEDITDRLTGRLDSGSLEAAIVATSPQSPRLRSAPLYREPFSLAVPRGHRLAARKSIKPSDLDPAELLLLADGHCLRDQALAVCGLEASALAAAASATSLETILNLVSAGHGITFVPALALQAPSFKNFKVLTRPFLSADADREIRVLHRAAFPQEPLIEQLALLIRSAVPASVTPIQPGR